MPAYVRDRLAITFAVVALLALCSPGAWAQATGTDQDRRPLHAGKRPRYPIPPDGGADRPHQGSTIVVEDRPGGGTVIGTEAVERAEPDGRTLLLVASSFVINPALKRANYDPARNFEPVCLSRGHADGARRAGLVALPDARRPAHRGARQAGRAGVCQRRTRILPAHRHRGAQACGAYQRDLCAVRRHGAGRQRADGQSRDRRLGHYPTVVSQLKAGTLRGLVTTSAPRVEALPNVPTLGETGISKYEADIFYGIVAPAKTPPDTIKELSGWLSKALKAPDMAPKLAQQGLFPVRRVRRGVRRLHAAAVR